MLPSPPSGTATGQGSEDALEDARWSGRTTRYRNVYGDDIRYLPAARITLAEHPARATAIAQRDDQLRLGCRFVGAQQRCLHVPRFCY